MELLKNQQNLCMGCGLVVGLHPITVLLTVLLVLGSMIQINVKHESEQIVIQYIYWGLDIKLSVWTRGL